MEEEKTAKDKIKEQVENELCCIADEGVCRENVDYAYKLVDIHKDLENEEYWENKEEYMRYGMYDNYGRDSYGTYGNYGGGRRRDSRGRYMEGRDSSSYGRRYRGHDMIDDMSENYSRYMENRENGRYGSPETDKSFDYMVQSLTDYIDHVFNEIDSPEQADKFKHEVKMAIERIM